jgi:hypothetical protein
MPTRAVRTFAEILSKTDEGSGVGLSSALSTSHAHGTIVSESGSMPTTQAARTSAEAASTTEEGSGVGSSSALSISHAHETTESGSFPTTRAASTSVEAVSTTDEGSGVVRSTALSTSHAHGSTVLLERVDADDAGCEHICRGSVDDRWKIRCETELGVENKPCTRDHGTGERVDTDDAGCEHVG